MARWFGMAVVVFWLLVMGVLFYRDVWPHWVAGDPPGQMPGPQMNKSSLRFQSGIFDRRGRVGTSWIHFYRRSGSDLIHTQTVLDGLGFLPRILVDSELTYTADGKLDSIKLTMTGESVHLDFIGENYGMDFSCELKTGPGPDDRHGFKLDAAAAATMSDALRPFTLLKGLRVGKTWRTRLINPLPALRGGRAEFESYLVRVAARETIEHHGKKIQCFRVVSRNLRAWVADDGRVLVQEVDLPIFGTLTIRQEPYDERARAKAIGRTGHGILNRRDQAAVATRRAGAS